MKNFLSDNWIVLVIGVCFLSSTILAIKNNYVIEKDHVVREQTELVKLRTTDILSGTMHGLDLGVRGFALTLDEKLLIPFNEAVALNGRRFAQLDSLLLLQQYPDREKLQLIRQEIDNYINFSKDLIELARAGETAIIKGELQKDRGYQVWATYSAFSAPLFEYENKLQQESLEDYLFAIRSNLILQISILILVMPMLYVFVAKVKNERKRREALLKEVDKTDRTFVFNDGQVTAASEGITKRSIEHIKVASGFIAAIAAGDYKVDWEGLTPANKSLNDGTLAGNLLLLRNRLQTVKLEDERRNWTNEGLAEFSDIVRSNQHLGGDLAVKCVSFLTKYLNAQQGSIFVVEGEGSELHLNLAGCYAFDRRKWIQKRIEPGAGLVGQVYLEGEPMMMKKVPNGYTTITSGLGQATPDCIAIVPMKYEGQTVAVAEFATFNSLEPYQISFLEKAGQFFASAIINTRNTHRMKTLLDEASEREQIMLQREEELRQNMEELQATQEELVRKQREPSYN